MRTVPLNGRYLVFGGILVTFEHTLMHSSKGTSRSRGGSGRFVTTNDNSGGTKHRVSIILSSDVDRILINTSHPVQLTAFETNKLRHYCLYVKEGFVLQAHKKRTTAAAEAGLGGVQLQATVVPNMTFRRRLPVHP